MDIILFEQLVSRYLNGKATSEEEQSLLAEVQHAPERKRWKGIGNGASLSP